MPERRHDAGSTPGNDDTVPTIDARNDEVACVPDALVDAAKGTWEHRRDEGEVAILVSDSAVERPPQVEPGSDVRLRFEHASLVVEVHVVGASEGSALHGSLHPSRDAAVELEPYGGGGSSHTDAQEGEFSFGRIAHGLVRLRVVLDEPQSIRTEWFRV